MKLKNLQAFAQAAAASHVIAAVIMAEDREDQKKALSSLQKGAALLRMQGDNFSKEHFLRETEQIDLFATKKMVVVEEAHLLKKEELALITRYLEKPHKHLTLVLLASENVGSPKQLQQFIEQGVLILTLLEEKSWDKKARLLHEAIAYLKKEKISIDPKLCAELIESQALDQSTLYQELEKMICYIGDRTQITKEDVAALTTPLFHQTIWNLVDSIFQRRTAEALTIGKKILTESSIHSILATLRGQMRSAVEILTLYQQQGKSAVTERYSYLKGNLLDKKITLLEGYGTKALSSASHIFFETELQLREGPMDEELILELLLIRLCRC